MDKTLKVRIENVYGRKLFYPENETARLFTTLVRKKSLSEDHIRDILAMGYEIEPVTPEITQTDPSLTSPLPATKNA